MNILVVTDSREEASTIVRAEERLCLWNIKIAYLPSSTLEKLAIEVTQEEARNK